MAETNLRNIFDPSLPRTGASVKSQELTDQLTSIATNNYGEAQPNIPAQIIGDRLISRIDLTNRYEIRLTVDGQGPFTIDLGSAATSRNSTSAEEIATAINNTLFANGWVGNNVAYTYSVNTDNANAAFILLRATATSGISSITLNDGTGSRSALDFVFGINSRKVSVPFTVNGSVVPAGYQWHKVSESDGDEIQIRLGSPAVVIGTRNLQNNVNLSIKRNLRLRITIAEGVFGPLDIDIQGASAGSTTSAEIISAINAAFVAEPNWPDITSGPASIVTRNGTGEFLKIVSGPTNNPQTGSNVEVQVSGIDPGTFLKDDALELVLGLAEGESFKRLDRIPHTFTGVNFTDSYVRGLSDRSGPGVGPWGKALEDKDEIPTTGVVDGEVRLAKNAGIPWFFREGQFGLSFLSGWRRAIPGWEYPVSYDRLQEKYRIASTSDDYIPEPLNPIVDGVNRHIFSGVESTAVSLVDSRDSAWPDTVYPVHPTEPAGFRNLYTDPGRYDDFNRSGTSLGLSNEGGFWTQTDGGMNTNGGVAQNAPGVFGTADALDDGYYHLAAGYLFKTEALGSPSTTFNFTITTPDVPNTAGIIAGSVHAVVVTPISGSNNVSSASFEAWDDGAGNFIGPNVSSGTIDYSTGAINLVFTSAVATGDQLRVSFSLTTAHVVCATLYKTTEVQSGNVCSAGVLYGAAHLKTGNGGINTNTGFRCEVRDDGLGFIVEKNGDSTETIRQTFVVDPPLDTTPRVLRVVFTPQGSTFQHQVAWSGSNRKNDWFQKEFHNAGGQLGSGDTAGGQELGYKTPLLTTLVQNSVVTPNGTYCGVTSRGASASGAFPAKSPFLQEFQIQGGLKDVAGFVVPGLPPISAIRTRDSIHSIKYAEDGVEQEGIITDCNHENPFTINVANDLASGSSVDVLNRTITLSLDFLSKFNTEVDLLWDPSTNPNGKIAVWRYGNDNEGNVSLNSETLNGIPLNSTQFADVGGGQGPNNQFWYQPSATGFIATTLPPIGAGWLHTLYCTVTAWQDKDDSAGGLNLAGGRDAIVTNSTGPVLQIRIPWKSTERMRPEQGTLWGIAVRI